MEELRFAMPFIMIGYSIFLISGGIWLFSKWLPILIRDKKDLDFYERVQFFYIRMCCEVAMIFMFVLMAKHTGKRFDPAIGEELWRGNYIFPLLLMAAIAIVVAPLTYLIK